MTGSLDTNLILRWLLDDVPEQAEQVSAMLESAKIGSFELADAVFFECVWVLSGPLYGFDRRIIADLVLQITRMPQIDCSRALIQRAMLLYVHHSGISFIDACLAVGAEMNDALPLLTYDKKLAKAMPDLVQLVA